MTESADHPEDAPDADAQRADDGPPRDDSGPQHRVARNFLFSVVSMLVATPLNIIGMWLMARRLGKETVGVCFSIFAIAIVVYILSGLGVATVLARRVAKDLKNLRRHVGEAAGVCLLVSLAAFPILLVAGLAWSQAKGVPMPWELFALAAMAIMGRHAMEFSVGALRGLERFEFETLTRFVQNGGFCLLVVTTVTPETGPLAAVGAFAISHFVAALVAGGVLALGFGCNRIWLSRASVRDWIGESWPLGWGDAVRGMGWHIDTILLSLLGTNVAVGIYNVAYRPLMPLRSVPRTLASATFPMISRLQDDTEKIAQVFSRSVNALWFAALPICIAISGCADYLVVTLMTEEFIEVVTPLRVMIWVTAALFITTQHRYLFAALGAQRVYSRLVTTTLLVKAVLLGLLIPTFGVYGACAGTVAAELLLLAMGVAACRPYGLAFLPWGRMSRCLAPAAAMAAIVWIASSWSGPWLLAATVAAGLVYVGLCLLCGVFDASELSRLRHVLGRLLGRPRQSRPLGETAKKANAGPVTAD